MNYISAEQFLKQPEEIQKVFMDWWQPKEGDKTIGEDWVYPDFIESELNFKIPRYRMYGDLEIGSGHGKNELIPLFRLDQLWNFIEETSKIPVNVKIRSCEYSIELNDILSTELGRDKDKFQALWKAAVKVAEMKVRGKHEGSES